MRLRRTGDRVLFPRHASKRSIVGWSALMLAVAALVVLAFLPSPYMVERPGPTFDALGDTEEGPIVTVNGEADETDDDGALRVLTVSLSGSPDYPLTWIDVAAAYIDKAEAIVPMDVFYAPGETLTDSTDQSAAEMSQSQQAAIAAALLHEDMDVGATVTVTAVLEDGRASGLLREGDVIDSVNSLAVYDVASIRAALMTTEGPADFAIVRDGVAQTVTVQPDWSSGTPLVGIVPQSAFNFPVDVNISLPDIGGPSAGLIFSLAILDRLDPGALTGGVEWAGTGTISALGEVGAIGGIEQKMYGAVRAGADWFLAPASNCADVVGNVPGGLQVVSVATLEEAVAAVETVATGDETAIAALPTCGATP